VLNVSLKSGGKFVSVLLVYQLKILSAIKIYNNKTNKIIIPIILPGNGREKPLEISSPIK
jgi:hypothetical protein